MAKTILTIEDDNFLQGLEATKLKKEGYEVLAASNSAEAFSGLGNAYFQLGRYSEARMNLVKSKDLFIKNGAPREVWQSIEDAIKNMPN